MAAKQSISLSILADVSEYAAGMRKIPGITEKQAAQSAKKMEAELLRGQRMAAKHAKTAAKKGAKAWGDSARSIGKAFAALGLAKVALEFAGLGQKIADARNELLDASTRTGIAAETLNGLKLAAEGSGLEFSNVEAIAKRLPRSMLDASKGIGTAKDAFATLGVSVTNADGSLRDADSVLKETARALGDVDNQTEKAALSMEIFGGKGAELLQALGGNELEDFTEIANRFGTKVGPEAAAQADRWQREVSNLKNVFRGALETIAPFGEDAAESLRIFQIAIVTVSTLVKESVSAWLETFKAAADGFKALLSGDLEGAVKGLKDGTFPALFKRLVEAKDIAVEAGESYAELAEKLSRVADTGSAATPAIEGTAQATKKAKAEAKAASKEFSAFDDAMKEVAKARGAIAKDAATDSALFNISQEQEALDTLRDDLNGFVTSYQVALSTMTEADAERAEAVQANLDAAIAGQHDLDARTMQLAEQRNERLAEIEAERGAAKKAASDMELANLELRMQDEVAAFATNAQATSDILGALFAENKAAALAGAIINTAAAVAMALQVPPGFPLNALSVGAAAAMGGAQISTIASQSFHTGLAMPAPALAPDEMRATLTRRERVLTPRGAAAAGGDSGVRELNRGGGIGGPVVIEQRYKHRAYDRFARDNIARDGSLRQGVQAIASAGGKVGKRQR